MPRRTSAELILDLDERLTTQRNKIVARHRAEMERLTTRARRLEGLREKKARTAIRYLDKLEKQKEEIEKRENRTARKGDEYIDKIERDLAAIAAKIMETNRRHAEELRNFDDKARASRAAMASRHAASIPAALRASRPLAREKKESVEEKKEAFADLVEEQKKQIKEKKTARRGAVVIDPNLKERVTRVRNVPVGRMREERTAVLTHVGGAEDVELTYPKERAVRYSKGVQTRKERSAVFGGQEKEDGLPVIYGAANKPPSPAKRGRPKKVSAEPPKPKRPVGRPKKAQ